MIRFDRLTVKTQEALADAQRLAERAGHQQIDIEHLALALVRQTEGLTQALLNKLGVDPGILQRELEQELRRIPQVSGAGVGQVSITRRVDDLFRLRVHISPVPQRVEILEREAERIHEPMTP